MEFEDKTYTKIFTIANHYGENQQREMLIEECAELIQAVQKLKRREKEVLDIKETTAYQNYLEELADVSIMVEQMLYFLSAKEYLDFTQIVENKLDRQLKRIEEEEKK